MIPGANLSLKSKGHHDQFSRFRTGNHRVSLYFTMRRPFPLKIAPFHVGSKPQSNTWFPGSIQVLIPDGISIGSAVFCRLTSVTDRQSDKPTDTTMLLSR